MKTVKRKIVIAGAVLVLCSSALAENILLGRGAGSWITADGGSTEFQKVISYRVTEGSKDSTVVLLSVQEIPESRARDVEYLAGEAKAGRLFALEIHIGDDSGKVIRHALYDARGRSVLPSPEKASWMKTHFSNTRIEGQTQYFPEPMKSPPPGYYVFFNARTRQGAWLDPDAVSGSIEIGKKRYPATAVALIDESEVAIIVASSRPLEQMADVDALASDAAREDFAVAWIVLERKKGQVLEASCFGPGLPGNQAEAPSVEWSKEEWNKSLMRGRIASVKAPADAPCKVDLYFAVAR